MNGRTNGHGRLDGPDKRWTDGRTHRDDRNERADTEDGTDERTDTADRTDERTDTDDRTAEWTDGRMDGRTNARGTDERDERTAGTGAERAERSEANEAFLVVNQ